MLDRELKNIARGVTNCLNCFQMYRNDQENKHVTENTNTVAQYERAQENLSNAACQVTVPGVLALRLHL